MKEENKSIIVMLGMFVLFLLIVLPPIFRMVFPKDSTYDINSKTYTLTCQKTFENSKYNTISRAIYQNNKIIENEITYISAKNNISNQPNDNTSAILPEEEFEYFKSLNNININDDEEYKIVVINKELLDSNQNANRLKNYFQSYDKLKSFYKKMGYKCSKD